MNINMSRGKTVRLTPAETRLAVRYLPGNKTLCRMYQYIVNIDDSHGNTTLSKNCLFQGKLPDFVNVQKLT